jgi:hypothetical protein
MASLWISFFWKWNDNSTISLEMPVPSQGHYGFHSFPVVDWFCLFIYLWVLTFPLEDCSECGNFVITLIYYIYESNILHMYTV